MKVETISYKRLNEKWVPKAIILNTNNLGQPIYRHEELLEEEYDTEMEANKRILEFIKVG